MVRRCGHWQRPLDGRILEYLRDHALGTSSEIARALPIPPTEYQVRERLRVLSQAEYVAPLTDDYKHYELTTWGRGYLHGRVRADLLVPAPDARRPGYVL